MSESEYFEAKSDSFWEIGQFKRTVKRTEDGYKLSNDLVQMLSERASLEKLYAKSLRSWSKKWNEYLEKSAEYGTMKATWASMTTEANSISEIHLKIHDDLEEQLITDIKAWQKQNYPKTIMNTLKIAKLYEDEFAKAQKPWAKKYSLCEKAKKEYHYQCKQLQTAKIQETNARNDSTLTNEQKKKYEDKAEKCRKEVDNAKHKYEQALDDINEYNARYIEDMKNVYKKCDTFERSRLDFFIQKFTQAHGFLDLTQKPQIGSIYSNFMNTISSSNPEKDLLYWSKTNGAAMGMNWPIFEEYSEEFKNIARNSKSTRITDDNGVTMTSIRQKEDQNSEIGLRSVNSQSSINSNKKLSNASSTHRVSRQDSYPTKQNPFSDNGDFSDEENNVHIIYNNSNGITPKNNSNYKLNASNKEIEDNRYENEPKANKVDEANPFGDSDDETETKNNDQDRNSNNNNNNNNNTYVNVSNISNSEKYLNIQVRAIYDYQPSEDDELSFKAGEQFTKLANEDDRGWCLGKIGNKIGLYPATYAIEI